MEVLFSELDKIFDVVIVDTPPVNVVADALSISPFVDGVTLVATDNKTTYTELQDAVKALSGLPNLYVDTSSSSEFMEKEEMKRIIDTYGTDKVLFGTDYPMWQADKEIEYLLSLGYSDSEYENIFAKNALRAYKIK